MEKIFVFIGRFKPQDEFIWAEYVNLLKFQEMLLNAKLDMIKKDEAKSDSFITDPSNEVEQRTRIYTEIYDSMVKQRYALMQLGWQNDK